MNFHVSHLGFEIWKKIRFQSEEKPEKIKVEGNGVALKTAIDDIIFENDVFSRYWLEVSDTQVVERFTHGELTVKCETKVKEREPFLREYLPKIGIVHWGKTEFPVTKLGNYRFKDKDLKSYNGSYGYFVYENLQYDFHADFKSNTYYFTCMNSRKNVIDQSEVEFRLESQKRSKPFFELFDRKVKQFNMKELLNK